MGSIGPAEILVVLVVALIVLGPNRLPDAARSIGKALAELRRMSSGLQAEVRDAFNDPPPTYPAPPPAPSEPAGELPPMPAPVVDPEVSVNGDGEPPRPG